MNLIWLDDFLALAATGNFSRAAEERHMTQPAFSRRIRALEEWLGVVLFDRTTHPVTLTEAGLWFRSVAQDTLAHVARLPDEARAVVDASAATLRIASTHALSFTFLPGWLRSLESRIAVGPIQLMSRRDAAMRGADAAGPRAVPALPCPRPGADGSIPPPTRRRWSARRIDPAVGARQGRAKARAAAATRTTVPILAYSAESGIGRLVRALRGAALEDMPQPVVTAHLATVLRTMVLDGRGVAWLPKTLVADELASGRLVAAGDESWSIAVEIRLFRQKATMHPAAERLWRTVLESHADTS